MKKGVAETKGRGRNIIFPNRVGSGNFFGETRDTVLSTGEEIRSPHGVLGHGKNDLYYIRVTRFSGPDCRELGNHHRICRVSRTNNYTFFYPASMVWRSKIKIGCPTFAIKVEFVKKL